MEYSTGYIYKLICTLDSDFIYIGSTFTTLSQRFHQHKSQYKTWLKDKKLNLSTYPYYDKYGIENFKIILIKSYKVCRESQRDNTHLKVYEQIWMNKSKRAVNIHKAFNPLNKLDRKEYYQNNKEKIKKYCENNKERKKEYDKKTYENNKEKIKECQKEYREKNKEREKEKITCECGSIIRKVELPRHKKSKKHLNFNLMKK
jgi:hypothetical protein